MFNYSPYWASHDWLQPPYVGAPPIFSQYTSQAPRFVTLWQPPASQEEVVVRSMVHLMACAKPKYLLRKLLPKGQRKGRAFADHCYCFALDDVTISELAWVLPQGGWLDRQAMVYGFGIEELHAHLNHCSYFESIRAIAGALEIEPDGRPRIPLMRQDRHPLHWQPDPSAPYWCGEVLDYRNGVGNIYMRVVRSHLPDGTFVRHYRTIWGYRKSGRASWVEALPEKPFSLFNLEWLARAPETPVLLVEDEFLASRLSPGFPGRILAAVPGSLSNLIDADLEPLKGREVQIVLGEHNLGLVRLFHQALARAGASSSYAMAPFERPMSLEAVEALAAARGVELISPPADQRAATQSSPVVTEAGQLIPGWDHARRTLLHPIIREGTLVWLFAEPKAGKTFLGLSIAHAVASGGRVGPWHSGEAFGVLYVDGEMLPDELHSRICMIMKGSGDLSGRPSFATICAKCQSDGVIDLASEEWQQFIEQALRGKKLLILDNFQSLTDNGIAVLRTIQPWLMSLTRMGIAVLILDHTNRQGDIQGTKAKERIADLTIALRHSDDTAKAEGRVLVEFPFARSLYGADAEPFIMRKNFTDDSLSFSVFIPTSVETVQVMPRFQRMAQVTYARDILSLSFGEIAERHRISKSTAHGDYMAARQLTGEEGAVFEAELQRLIDEDEPDGL